MTFQTEPLSRPSGAREILNGLSARAARLRSEPWFAAMLRALSWAWPLALVALLVFYLVRLGWVEIWQALPSSWLFFALIPVLYLLPAAGDLLIYRRFWRVGDRLKLSVMLHKNAINTAVMGLSGEFYLVMWARRHVHHAHRFILHSVMDSNALSTLAGTMLLSGLLLYLALSGQWSIPLLPVDLLWMALLAASVPSILFGLVLAARRMATVLSKDQLAFAFGLHLVRTAIGYAIVVSLWSLALPSVPLRVWLNFLALRLLISCVAMLPNRELLWLSAGVGIAGVMDLPQAGVAAMLITMTAGEYICHLVFVGLPTLMNRVKLALAAPEHPAHSEQEPLGRFG